MTVPTGDAPAVRLAVAWLAVVAALLVVFAAATVLGLPVLDDPGPALRSAGAFWGALAGLAVLTVDVVLPVPSSLVMVAFGTAYGVAVAAALSTLGGALMAFVGGTVGRRGGRLVADADRARHLVDRYGVAAVVLTRPVPLLAESVVLVAGAAGMPLRRLVLGAALGTLPLGVVYGVAGAYGRQADAGAAFVVLGVLALAALARSGPSRRVRQGGRERREVGTQATGNAAAGAGRARLTGRRTRCPRDRP